LSIFKTGQNPNVYALCNVYYDSNKIDIPCEPSLGVPSTSPSTSVSPTSSSVPTSTPDCSCDVGEFKFELQLKTDEYPVETSWHIEDGNGDNLVSESGYNDRLKIFNHEYCLPVGCHDFVIDDSYGDGICCSYGEGYYRGIVYGWNEVFDGGEFGSQAIESFCGEDVCPFATHYPSTSPSVSLIPTSSSAPSMDPQIFQIPNTPFYIGMTGKYWDECKSHAESYHFDFASIRNQQENDAVADYLQVNSIASVWLGGYQTSSDDEPAGNWVWLDGSPWTDSTYTNWNTGEPNDENNEENYLELYNFRKWNDKERDRFLRCLFRDPTASFAQKNSPTTEPTTSSKTAATTASLNIETLTWTALTFFESIVTFFKNLLPF